MFVFLFIVACIIFVSTITWLSFKLAQTRTHRPKLFAVIGFCLAFVPPAALVFIAILAFKDESADLKFDS